MTARLAISNPDPACIVFAIALMMFTGTASSQAVGMKSAPLDYSVIEATIPVSREVVWWKKRHLEKVKAASAGTAEMIMVGDSLVHNFETSGRQIWNLYFGRYQPLNLGFNADLTEHVIWRLQNGELAGLSPRLAVIMIGTNNGGLRRDPPEFTTAGIAAIISEIRNRLPETRILLLGIFPRGPFPNHPLRILNAQVNKLLPELAEADPAVRFLDISPVFLDANGFLHREIMHDFLHPTVKGYQLWAEAISPTVLQMMEQ